MAWTDISYPYASQLTAAKMSQATSNFTALMHGESGAPRFVTAAFGACVDRSALATATANGSVTIRVSSQDTYALAGGEYSWWTIGVTSSGATRFLSFGAGDVAAGVLGFRNTSVNCEFIAYIDERYVQASPPYDIGDGHIPVFAFMKKFGNEITAIQVAQDPPWAYHGPTNIQAHRRDSFSGRSWRNEQFIGDLLLTDAWKNPELRFGLLSGELVPITREVEITQDWKNRDMLLHPHPFKVSSGESVIFIDHKSSNALLNRYEQNGAIDVRHFLEHEATRIRPSSRKAPYGVFAAEVIHDLD